MRVKPWCLWSGEVGKSQDIEKLGKVIERQKRKYSQNENLPF